MRLQVAELLSCQFPGDHDGPRKWLNLVSGLIDTADLYLESSEKIGIDAAVALNLVGDAAKLATEAYQCLVLMRGAGMDELPYPIVPPLQRWFTQMQLANSTFFRAELVANYELYGIEERWFKGIRDPSPSLQSAIGAVVWPLLRVTVPSKAFAIIPHLAIVAHEIGHALFHKIAWDLSPFASEETAIRQRIAARLNVAALDKATKIMLVDVFSRWHQELSADAFAYYLTGPAIFFSLSEFFQFIGGYGLSPTHPANDLRRGVLFSRICEGDDGSFAKIFEKWTGQGLSEDFNSAMIQPTPDKNQIFQDAKASKMDEATAAVLAELNESMPKLVTLIYDHVSRYLNVNAPTAIYSAARFDHDLRKHLLPMLAAVPPVEEGEALETRAPTDFASILNVGWAVLLTKLPELRVKTSGPDQFNSERLERLHGLLLKAVELSEARRVWAQA